MQSVLNNCTKNQIKGSFPANMVQVNAGITSICTNVGIGRSLLGNELNLLII